VRNQRIRAILDWVATEPSVSSNRNLLCAGHEDAQELAAVGARAFLEDPIYAWLFPIPDLSERATRLQSFFEADLRALHLPKKLTFCTPDRRAFACWDPPGDWRVSFGRQLSLLPTIVRVLGARTLPALRGLARVQAKHPSAPHYYLFLIATMPGHQGKGLGTCLLEAMTARADTERLGVYLESTNPRNEPWYRRHGFRAEPPIHMAVSCPPITPMWRAPR
jgi:GNAT superfamily N-acetyltransferase